MSCLINRNEKGQIVEVSTKEGGKSELFENIHNNPFLGSAEVSAKILSLAENVKTKDVYENGEPKLFYQAGEQVFDNLEDVFVNELEGNIALGFKDQKGDFQKVATFSTNATGVSNFLSQQIRDGFLATKRVLGKDGITRFVAKGEFPKTKKVLAGFFAQNVQLEGLSGNVKVNEEGEIEVAFPPKGLTILTKNGEVVQMNSDEIPQKLDQIENQTEAMVFHVQDVLLRTNKTKTENPDVLGKALMTFLQQLGFSPTTLENYQKRYNTLFGKDPDIQALTDIANRVVAFANGQITAENLSEEVAHIALEAYSDQESIEDVLAEVYLTEEYNEFAEYYRAKYAPFFEGVDLETQVRKEVLGKILAKTLQNKLTDQRPETQGIVERLKEIFNSVINYFKAKLRPSHITQLNTLNERIADAVIKNDISQFNNDTSKSNRFFYSATSSRAREIVSQLIDARKQIERIARNNKALSAVNLTLQQITEEMDMLDSAEGAMTIVGIFDQLVTNLESSVKSAEARNENLSPDDLQTYSIIKNQLLERANMIDELLREALIKDNTMTQEQIKRIEKYSKKVSEILKNSADRFRVLDPKIQRFDEQHAYQILQEELAKSTASKEDKEKIEKDFIAQRQDASTDMSNLSKFFSFTSQSRNPALAFIARRVQQMRTTIVTTFQSLSQDFLNAVEATNATRFDSDILQRRANGTFSAYFRNGFRKDDHAEEKREEAIRIVSRLTGQSVEDIKKKLGTEKNPMELLTKESDISEFSAALREWDTEQRITPTKKAYRDAFAQKQKALKFAPRTALLLQNLSAQRYSIVERALNRVNNTVDYSLLTDSEKQNLAGLKKARATYASPINSEGQFKEGLSMKKAKDLTAEEMDDLMERGIDVDAIPADFEVVVRTQGLEDLDIDSRVAFDLNMANLFYSYPQEATAKRSFDKFLEKLKTFGNATQEERKAMFQWAKENMSIGLSEDYYATLNDEENYEKAVENWLKTFSTDSGAYKAAKVHFDEWKRLNRQRRSILKQNRKTGNSLDINVSMMNEEERKTLILLEEKIAEQRRFIELPKERVPEVSAKPTLTEEFYKMATEANLNELGKIKEFAMKHMTAKGRENVEKFHVALTQVLNGQILKMSKKQEEFIADLVEQGILDKSMDKETVIKIAVDEYAKTYVAGYFKRYSPPGFETFMQDLESGGVSFQDVFEKKITNYKGLDLSFVDFRPEYSWSEDSEIDDRIDKRYNSQEFYLQLEDKWINEDDFNYFGISVNEFKNSEHRDFYKMTPTKNIEAFNHLKRVVELRKQSLSLTNDTQSQDPTLRPQISMSSLEKVSLGGIQSLMRDPKTFLREGVKDFFQYRPDEMVKGEQLQAISNEPNRVVPKYFRRRLPPESLTQSITSAVLLELKEAIAYQERTKANKDVNSLVQHISRQTFIPFGISLKGGTKLIRGSVSKTLEAAKEFQDHHIYGVQQATNMTMNVAGVEIDFTKLIYRFQRISSFSNLAFNPAVAATGFTTGLINRAIYKTTQRDISKESMLWAERQALRDIPRTVTETLNLQRKTKLGIILETLGLEDIQERISESKLGKVGRGLNELPFFLDKLGNFGFKPQIAYALLKDNRVIEREGEIIFVNHKQFVGIKTKQLKEEGIPDSKIPQLVKTAWQASENMSMFDFMEAKDGKLNITTPEIYKEREAEFQKAFKNKLEKVGATAQALSMRIDGVIPEYERMAAQRNVLTNTLLQHQGWFVIFLQKKFGKRFFDFNTDKYMEGEYRLFLNFISAIFTRKALTDPRGLFKVTYQQLDDYQQESLTRSAVEFAVMAVMLVIGAAVIDGDDDDEYLADFARLIYLRTTSEIVTGTAFGIAPAIKDRLKAPIPMWNQAQFIMDAYTLALEDIEKDRSGIKFLTEPKGGKQTDDSKFLYRLYKLTPFRRLSTYSNLDRSIRDFRYYNDASLDPVTFLPGLSLKATEKRKRELKDENYNDAVSAYDNLRVN